MTWDIKGVLVDGVWPKLHVKRQVECLPNRGIGCVFVCRAGVGKGSVAEQREGAAVWGLIL